MVIDGITTAWSITILYNNTINIKANHCPTLLIYNKTTVIKPSLSSYP